MRIEGFDEVRRKLNNLIDNANKINGTNEVSFNELFNDNFMNNFTNSNSFNDFIDNFKKDLSEIEFKKILQSQEWNDYVAKNSNFSSWDNMCEKATEIWTKNKLGF